MLYRIPDGHQDVIQVSENKIQFPTKSIYQTLEGPGSILDHKRQSEELIKLDVVVMAVYATTATTGFW